jgi:hypothetical protein
MGSYAAELQDPSAIEFCLLVTGITTTLGGLSSGACLGFEEAEILDIDTCTIELCGKGVDGFEDFLIATFKYIRKILLLLPASWLSLVLGRARFSWYPRRWSAFT